MAKYYIPPRYRQGFKSLLELDGTSLELLTSRMAEFPVGGGPSDLIKFLHDLPIPNIDDISATIYSFGNILIDRSKNIEDISLGLVKSYLSEESGEVDVDIKSYNDKLLHVFSKASNIKTSYKALALSNEVPNIFRESAIISDIRIIFSDDVNSSDRHALVSQQLRILYAENSQEKSFFVNLDKNDLEDLRDQIDRALTKEKILRSEYSETFKIIDIGN